MFESCFYRFQLYEFGYHSDSKFAHLKKMRMITHLTGWMESAGELLFSRMIIFAFQTGSLPLFSSPGGWTGCKVLMKTPQALGSKVGCLTACFSSFLSFPNGGIDTFGVEFAYEVSKIVLSLLSMGKLSLEWTLALSSNSKVEKIEGFEYGVGELILPE